MKYTLDYLCTFWQFLKSMVCTFNAKRGRIKKTEKLDKILQIGHVGHNNAERKKRKLVRFRMVTLINV